MAEKYLKRILKSLVSRGMKVKRTLRFYLTPNKMAKIKISVLFSDVRSFEFRWACWPMPTILRARK